MTDAELIELGRKSFDEIHNDRWSYDRAFGKPPYYHLMPEDYGERYKTFYKGWKESHDAWYKKRMVETGADKFGEELREICKKYGVTYFSDDSYFKIGNFYFGVDYHYEPTHTVL